MRICLTMVVKNEEHVIERALRSALPFIDCYSIVDTGSTDRTVEIIQETLRSVPGQILAHPWEGFGATRTKALRLAELGYDGTDVPMPRPDYLLLLDADDYLESAAIVTFGQAIDLGVLGSYREHLNIGAHDLYECRSRFESIEYARALLVRAGAGFKYTGRTHEFLDHEGPSTKGVLEAITYVWTEDSARRKNPILRFQENVEALTLDIEEDPENAARWTFYLAQEYKDAGALEKALEIYDRRARMPGWPEETWRAAYEGARLAEQLALNDVVARYRHAYAMRPERVEPLVDLARVMRAAGHHTDARIYAQAAMGVPMPKGERLFLDPSYYGWRREIEYALALWWTGSQEESIQRHWRLLDEKGLPTEARALVSANLGACGVVVPEPRAHAPD
jgi:glycosyltransferase involved in cell wall biosynthesis